MDTIDEIVEAVEFVDSVDSIDIKHEAKSNRRTRNSSGTQK